MGQVSKPRLAPSEHPNRTTKIGSKMGGEFSRAGRAGGRKFLQREECLYKELDLLFFWLRSLIFFLSFFLSFFLFVLLSLFLSLFRSFFISVFPDFFLFAVFVFFISVFLDFFLSISLCLSLSLSIRSIYLSIYLSAPGLAKVLRLPRDLYLTLRKCCACRPFFAWQLHVQRLNMELKAKDLLWMDTIHFTPPKKPWNDSIRL